MAWALEDPCHAGHLSGGQNGRGHRSVPAGGRDHHDVLHPGDLGRDGIHQYGGRIGGGTAWDIDPHPGQRKDPLSQDHSVPLGHHKALSLLLCVVGPDVVRRLPQDGQELRLHLLQGGLQLRTGHAQAGQLRPVEAAAILVQGAVPLRPDCPDDVGHRRGHIPHLVTAEEDLLVLYGIEVIDLNHSGPLTGFSPGRPASAGPPGA